MESLKFFYKEGGEVAQNVVCEPL